MKQHNEKGIKHPMSEAPSATTFNVRDIVSEILDTIERD
jgi:hypothetical protein